MLRQPGTSFVAEMQQDPDDLVVAACQAGRLCSQPPTAPRAVRLDDLPTIRIQHNSELAQ